ncbi:MAG: enoyl-CoA hydratase [SAR86 cluster bacterium]|uniref:Enoyl-CoA hydratase n=1 Tax=SAR86 cluster bacterium TaxID=2030880 RepID=A0A2A5B3D5_9GAMM|nr:MAG: enoyl-CoA hydratase [SAR86 cluster bacterium]
MFESKDPNVIYSVDGKVLVIQINRPEKKNALLPGMYNALADGLKLANESEAINVILIRGVDDCFTSGNDVNGFVNSDSAEPTDRPSVNFMHALNDSRKPIVAAVSGLAIGIGTTLLFHCDLVYASENCFLQLPFTRLGLCPEAASSYLLPRQIGYLRAAELLLLGDRFSSSKACEYGIVNEVLPQDQYLAHASSKAQELAALPPQAVQTSKQLMKRTITNEVPEAIEVELKEFSTLLQTPEAQAIMQAFLNKKKAG